MPAVDQLFKIISPNDLINTGQNLLIVAGLAVGGYVLYISRDMILKNDLVRNLLLKWPIECRIYEDREGGVWTTIDRARVIEDTNNENTIACYELKHMKVKLPVPELEHLMQGTKGQIVAHFYSPSRDIFYPVTMVQGQAIAPDGKTIVDIKLHPQIDEKMKMHYRNSTEIKYRKYYKPDMWEKYLPAIMVTLIAVSAAIILMVTTGRLELIAESFTNMVGPLTQIAAKLPAVATQTGTPPV